MNRAVFDDVLIAVTVLREIATEPSASEPARAAAVPALVESGLSLTVGATR